MSTPKRPASEMPSETSNAQRYNNIKRAKLGNKPLDGWLAVPLPTKPELFGVSEPLFDRDSVFIGYAAQAESTQDINRVREYILQVANPEYRDDPASHVSHGARFLGLRTGRSGLEEKDFEVRIYSENDGEARAGQTIIDTLAKANACDVIVCVARWFGGTMLGPKRFEWISKVTVQAVHALRDQEELQTIQAQLLRKDEEIYSLLQNISKREGRPAPSIPDVPNYDALDLMKAKRLLAARDARIKNLTGRLEKLDAEERELGEELLEISNEEHAVSDSREQTDGIITLN